MKIFFWALLLIGFAAISWGAVNLSSEHQHMNDINGFQDGLLDAYRSGASEEQIAVMEENFREYRQKHGQRTPFYVPLFAVLIGYSLATWAGSKQKSLKNATAQEPTDDLLQS